MTPVGKKRHRVTLQRRTDAENSQGQTTDAWADVVTLWAEVRTLAGRELATAHETNPETSMRIVARAGEADIRTSDRLDFEGRKLNVLAVYDPEERGREVWIDCAEQTETSDA